MIGTDVKLLRLVGYVVMVCTARGSPAKATVGNCTYVNSQKSAPFKIKKKVHI